MVVGVSQSKKVEQSLKAEIRVPLRCGHAMPCVLCPTFEFQQFGQISNLDILNRKRQQPKDEQKQQVDYHVVPLGTFRGIKIN